MLGKKDPPKKRGTLGFQNFKVKEFVAETVKDFFLFFLKVKYRGADFPMGKWRSAVIERADIPLTSPIFSSELPASVTPTRMCVFSRRERSHRPF